MARKDLPSPNAPNFLARVREEVHALLGKLGSGSDRALTLRDAIDSGVIVPGPGGSLIPGPGAGAAEEPDLTPPPQPGAFTATGAISHFLISQAQPFYTQGHGHSRTVVYGAQWVSGPLPVFADAAELDRFAGTVRAVASNPATTWRLWIKWESNDGVLSAIPAGGTNGVAVTTGQDVALLLDALAGQITSTELASSLSTPIGQIPSISGIASEALTKANANLAAIGTIQTELATLSGTPDYDNAATYELDDIVKYSGSLYRALGTTTGNLPTNTAYWQKIGDYASLGDAVSAHAAQLSDHETRITDAEGDLTAEATARETLATQLRGSYAGTDITMVSAGLIHSERQARSTADSTEVSARQALSAKLTGAADPASLTLGTLASGLLYDELQARASNDAAQVARIETMETAVNSPSTGLATKASLTQLATVESNAAGALATAQTTLNSTIAGLGGENLYVDRDPLVSGPTMYGDSVYIKNGSVNPLGLLPGETLTLSADLARDASAAAEGAHVTLYMWWQNEAGGWVGSAAISGYTDVPTRHSQSIALPALASDMVVVGVGVYKQGGATNVAGTATATRIQIERGSVATAYKIGLRNASAAITTLQQTQASQGLSIGSLTTAVQTAQNTADSKASTSYVDSVEARVDTVEGTVSSQGTLISGLSSDLSDLTGVVGTKANSSALTETNTNVSNLAGTVSAQAGQITTLQSQVAGNAAAISSEATTRATQTGELYAQYTVKTDVGGLVSGYGLASQATNGDPVTLAPGLHSVSPERVLSVQRASTATYVDDAGVLQTAAANVARYQGGQLLVEGQATNFVWPAKMADELYNCTGVFVSGVLPDGTTSNTIFRVSPSAGANVRIGDTSSGSPGTLYSGSVYARSVDGGTYSWNVDLNDSTANTFEVGPQWVRMSSSHTRQGAPYRFMDLYPLNGSTAQVEFCFPQITEGGLSSYIPTTTSPATRAADNITIINPSVTSAFGVQASQFFVAPPAVAAATAPTAGLFRGYAWRDTTANVTKYWDGFESWTTTPQTLPFVVQTVPTTINGVVVPPGVYMDSAYMRTFVAQAGQIGALAVDDAAIASVSASKITAGSIAVGQYIQSTGIYPGDGTPNFRVDGNGLAILNQAVVRGIVYASGGEFTGTVRGATIIGGTLTTAESGQRVKIDEQGILFLTGASNGKYGSFKYGAKKYGDGVLVYFNNSIKRVPFYVNSEQDVADIHLYNRAANPPAGEPGDIICVNSRLKTWDAVENRWRTLAFSD